MNNMSITQEQLAALENAALRARSYANEARQYADSAVKKAEQAEESAADIDDIVRQIASGSNAKPL